MQTLFVNDNNLWVNIIYIFYQYHACVLTKREAFLQREMPQIQIQNPFYFLIKLIGKLLCKKTQPFSQAKICLQAFLIYILLSFSDQAVKKKKQFLIFKGHNITNCFLFYNQTKAQILLLPQPQRVIVLICCQMCQKITRS